MLSQSKASGWRAARSQARKGVFPLALLVFPLFLSVDLDNVSQELDNVINAWKIVSTLIIAFLYINRLIGHKRASAHILPMVMVMVMLLFSTIANSGSLERYFVVWGGFFAVGILIEANVKERPLQLLLALKVVLGLIVVLNFATVLARPEGLWSSETEGYWLLGHRNNFGTPHIAAIVVSCMYDLLSRGRLTLSTLIIAGASFVSVVLTWSATSLVTVVLAIGAILLVSFGKKGVGRLKPFLLLALYIAADIGIVLFQIQKLASGFITGVLDRSTDLTGRTRIWELVFDMIRRSPIWGHGVQLSENNGLTIYNPNFVHAHNGELDILMQGGLLTFIPFVILVFLATRNASRYYEQRAVQVLYIGLILIMVHSITGLFFSSYAVLLVFLLLNSQRFAEKANEFAQQKANLQPQL